MTAIHTHRQPSDLTVTDIFCGAGGNTIGAKKAGLRVRVGLNHWDRAIETYGQNNPEVDVVERVDVSLCDPRRYPSTDIGIFSPECTTHSPAGGNRHGGNRRHPDLFEQRVLDPATVRSRVTMFDVVRFTEYHRYRIVIVENVVEATRWELFPDWLRMMDHLGYRHRILSLNSMFFHPTPQSRDRIYVVFWERGNRPPRLEYSPPAPCPKCGVVEAVQAWKPGRSIGKYKRQYIYACPRCAGEVTPYYYCALNALDFSIPAERIGDRSRPLRPRTLERIEYGLRKYGRRHLVVQTNMTSGVECRVRDGAGDPLPTQAASAHHGIVSPFLVNHHHSTGGRHARPADEAMQVCGASGTPALGFLVETAQSHSPNRRPRGLEEPMPTQGTQLTSALVSPFLVSAGSRESSAAGTAPMPTQTGSERLGVVAPVLVTQRTNSRPIDTAEGALTSVCTGGHHMLVGDSPVILRMSHGSAPMKAQPATDALSTQTTAEDAAIVSGVQISMRDADAMRVAPLDRELATQGCGPQQAVMSRSPYLVSYYGTEQATAADDPVPAVTTVDRHGVVTPELRVEDCYFRMLQPHEIGAAMAFPSDYVVGGNKRDRVKQYGNAVTPPVMDWIVTQCAASLAPELEERVA